MKGYRFYFITGLAFLLLQAALGYFVVNHIVKAAGVTFIENDLQRLRSKTNDFASALPPSSEKKSERAKVLNQIQNAITGTENEPIFITAIDWSGKTLAHPDVTKLGTEVKAEEVGLGSKEMAYSAEDLYELLDESRNKPVYLQPIPNSDIILIGNINILYKNEQIREFRSASISVISLASLVLLLFVLGTVRWLTSRYEVKLDAKTARFEDSVLNLEKLNISLDRYQEQLAIMERERSGHVIDTEKDESKESEKQRILTYIRNELLPVNTHDISYVYVDNTITYIVQKSGKRSTTNESLDQIYRHLDEKLFFRANRQIIVAISAIQKITKYGNSQLKIEVEPVSDINIIIGKNKAAAFKQWLDL